MIQKGFLALESGSLYPGFWHGGAERAGEVVFNTSHSGYEEMATDPSYYGQILVTTAPMQGNYGVDRAVWESRKIWIDGFICLEMQKSELDKSWLQLLLDHQVPVLSEVDTRALVMELRSHGTPWGAIVKTDDPNEARSVSQKLIAKRKSQDSDWVFAVTRERAEDVKGENPSGPKVAVLDFGVKENTLRELKSRCSWIRIFPSRTKAQEIKEFNPDGIVLSNGPGDPAQVQVAVNTVRELLNYRFMFGICMGHQILSLALGGKTYRLKYGHRGANHPISDRLTNKVYMTTQNHGFCVEPNSLPAGVQVTHVNLNDNTVSGILCAEKKCMSVQFHPESHPGPHDAQNLFDYFMGQLR